MVYLQPTQFNTPKDTFTYQDEEYKLKSHDIIAIDIFSLTPGKFDFFSAGESGEEGKKNNQFVIDKQGMVELPAVGKVQIAELTIQEAQDSIKVLLEDYLKSPLVRISLQTPFVFSILGESNSPGRYIIIGKEMNILEAIAHSGDLSPYADRANVRLMRKEKGVLHVHQVNLLDNQLLNSDLYELHSEDIIIIDPLPARSIRENQLFVITSVLGAIGGIAVFLRLIL